MNEKERLKRIAEYKESLKDIQALEPKLLGLAELVDKARLLEIHLGSRKN